MNKHLFFIYLILPLSIFCQKDGVYNSLESALLSTKNVKELDLSKKKIKEFPKEILQFENLEKLILSRNSLREIPKDIVLIKNLHYLDLSSNYIEQLPKEMSALMLDTIKMWDNPIRNFPPEFSMISNTLKYLDLRAIQMNKSEQKAIKELFPRTRIRMDHPCNCGR